LKINFINKANIKFSIEFKSKLKDIVKYIAVKEDKKITSLSLIYCTDEIIKDYNKKYLGHDYATDIITFHDVNENGETEGELLMSAETIKENAGRFNTEPDVELMRVVIHGVLHLCGYKDKTKKQKVQMRLKENYYLKIN